MYAAARLLSGMDSDPLFPVTVNMPAAVSLLRRCVAEHSHPAAMRDLAEILLDGAPGVRSRPKEAISLYRRCITETGDQDSTIILADALNSNDRPNVPRSAEVAHFLYQNCMEQTGNNAARLGLADILWKGARTVPRDIPKAADLFDFCADDLDFGDCEAVLPLATILISGFEGVGKDLDYAEFLCDKYAIECEDYTPLIDLAKDVAHGTYEMESNVPFAVKICEICIENRNDPDAMLALAQIIAFGAPGVRKDVDRTLQLCQRFVDIEKNCFVVESLAIDVYRRMFDYESDPSFAIQLLEMCINGQNSKNAIVLLAELFFSSSAGELRDVGRGLSLCRQFVEEGGEGGILLNLAMDVAYGTWDIPKDVLLAVEICEILVLDSNGGEAMAALAEIFSGGVPGMDVTKPRIARLCERSVYLGKNCEAVVHFADRLARGTFRLNKNMELAAQICEMCIEKMNDPHAMILLARILLAGSPEVRRDCNRAVELFKKAAGGPVHTGVVISLAKDIATGSVWIARNVPLAEQILMIYIEKTNNTDAKLSLASILLIGEDNREKHESRVLQLCEQFMNEESNCRNVVNLAREIAYGKLGMARNGNLAMKICRMCVSKRKDPRAVMLVAEHVLTEHLELIDNAGRCLDVCRWYLYNFSNCKALLGFANALADGTSRAGKNLKLAIQIYELCISRKHSLLAMVLLARVLLSNTPGIQNMERARYLCETYVDESSVCDKLADLARDLWTGTPNIERNVPLAIQLCEICIIRQNDISAMVVLAEIMVSGGMGKTPDKESIMRLCRKPINSGLDCTRVSWLAKQISEGTAHIEKNVELAVLLCKTCINKRNDSNAMFILAEILLENSTDTQDIEHAVKLCHRSVDLYVDPYTVADLAKRVARGQSGIVANLSLAKKICEISVEKQDSDGMVILAEILLTGSGEVERDEARALELCQRSLDTSYDCFLVVDLARMISRGKLGLTKDIELAIHLCEICMDRRDDPGAMFALVQILIRDADNIEDSDVERVLELCERVVEDVELCELVVDMADQIANGAGEYERDEALAEQLYDICVRKGDSCKAMFQLSKILLARGPEASEDWERAFHLCRRAVAAGFEYENC